MSEFISKEERESAIEYLSNISNDYIDYSQKYPEPLPEYFAIETAIKMLATDVRENIHGEWEVYSDCEGKTRTCTCNICGYKTGKYTWKNPNFCAECGADMQKPTKDDELIDLKEVAKAFDKHLGKGNW